MNGLILVKPIITDPWNPSTWPVPGTARSERFPRRRGRAASGGGDPKPARMPLLARRGSGGKWRLPPTPLSLHWDARGCAGPWKVSNRPTSGRQPAGSTGRRSTSREVRRSGHLRLFIQPACSLQSSTLGSRAIAAASREPAGRKFGRASRPSRRLGSVATGPGPARCGHG